MKTLEYNSKRLAKRIRVLMKESSNVIVSPNTSKEEPKMQEAVSYTHLTLPTKLEV